VLITIISVNVDFVEVSSALSATSALLFVKVLSCRKDFLCFSFVSFAFNFVFLSWLRGFGFPPLPEPALERSEGFLHVSKVLVYQRKSA
jgi:hypothetical protein